MASPCTSCSSSGYDSENERNAALTNNLQERRSTKLHVHNQQELLLRYRHIQDLLEASQACLTGCNNGFTTLEGGCSKRLREDASMVNADNADLPMLRNSFAWSQHEVRWRALANSVAFGCLQAIPWPPSNTGIIQAIVWHEQSEAQSNTANASHATDSSIKYGDSDERWRRAYQQALLRWHPDKMLHRLKSIPSRAGQEVAMQQVHQIFGSIQNEWQQLQHEW